LKYLVLMVALAIMACLGISGMVLADGGTGEWVQTDCGMVYIDKSCESFQMLGKGAQEAALVVGYGNPHQYFNGVNIDTNHWLANKGDTVCYLNWMGYQAAKALGNQRDLKDCPIIPYGYHSESEVSNQFSYYQLGK